MARPKHETREQDILEAAVTVFARRGFWSTPTSAISREAGIAEGTLFSYFKTKDELLNALYRALKLQFAEAVLKNAPRDGDLEATLRHLWNGFFEWALAHPDHYAVMAQLKVCEALTEDTRRAAGLPFADVEQSVKDAIRDQIIQPLPFDFMAGLLAALLDATIAAAAARPRSKKTIRAQGFDVFWRGIRRTSP